MKHFCGTLGIFLLILGGTLVALRAANMSSTVWQILVQTGVASGTSIDSTIHPAIIAAGSQIPVSSATGILPAANGGTGFSSLNQASIAQTVCTRAGNPYVTLNGVTYGVANTLWTCVMPAGTMGPFDVVEMHWSGEFQNNTGGSQNVNFFLTVGGSKFLSMSGVAQTSSALYHTFNGTAYFYGDGATNLNTLDGVFNIGTAVANEQLGVMSAATQAYQGSYAAMAVDTTADQSITLQAAVGVASPAPTYSAAPTSATTPIMHLFGMSVRRWPGITPTPTPTSTP